MFSLRSALLLLSLSNSYHRTLNRMTKENTHRTSERSDPHHSLRKDRKHEPTKGGGGGSMAKKNGAGGHNWVG